MPIQLDKIMSDIAAEKALHPIYANSIPKKDIDEAWLRVGKKNKLSVHEARSIFKVLQKKYEQEKVKESSSWKLFRLMENMHKKKIEERIQEKEDSPPIEEDEFIEMLEVHDEEEVDQDDSASNSVTPNNSPDKPEKSDTGTQKTLNQKTQTLTATSKSIADNVQALNKAGLTIKKTASSSNQSTPTIPTKAAATQGLHNALAAAVKAPSKPPFRASSITDLKRKSSTDSTSSSASKKPTTQIQIPVEIKQEPDETTASSSTHPKINVITIPGNTSSNGNFGVPAASSTNGFSPRIEDIDFRNDIIFDNGATNQISKNPTTDIINIGNFDNQLPPTFFKNLCNSNRYESLGLYIANVLNRVSHRVAAKLELNILRAIIDAKSEEMEH